MSSAILARVESASIHKPQTNYHCLKMSLSSDEPEIEEVSEELHQKFCKILVNHGITEEVESIVMTHPPELKGEHMATATVYVSVNFKNKKMKPKNLFVKKFGNNETFTEVSRNMKIMEKESEFFNNFLPCCREFCKRFEGCENFLKFFPTFLYGDENMVVLENHVLNDNFIMLPKKELQDFETAKYVLGNLARFHAVTFSVIEECGRDAFRSEWEIVCHEALLTENHPFAHGMFDNSINTGLMILKSVSVPGSEEAASKLSSLIGHTFKNVLACIETSPEDKLVVVNHGDCWSNNMLFKVEYDSDGKRILNEHMFVDLQVTRFTSSCVDICYFLYTSVKPEIRRDRLSQLLRHYYDTLSSTFNRFHKNCPLTYEEFFADFKKRAYYGYLCNINFLTLVGALKELTTSLEDIGATTPEEIIAGFVRVMSDWIDRNPDKSIEISSGLIAAVKEYESLSAS